MCKKTTENTESAARTGEPNDLILDFMAIGMPLGEQSEIT